MMSQDQDYKPKGSFSSQPRTAIESPGPKSRLYRWWRRARRALGWCLSLSVMAFCLAGFATSWLLHRELTAVVDRGEPLQLGKLVPALVPDGQNAASVYLRAAGALLLTKAEAEELDGNQSKGPDTGVLGKNQAAIKLVREAAAMPACRFPIDYDASNLAGILLPHLGKMHSLADTMRAQALWEAQRGQTDAALNDVAVLFRMSEHVVPEPILVSGVTAMAIERSGYKTLARVLNDVALSPAQAQAFALRLPHTDWTAAFHHDLLGERCFGLWAFQYVSNPIEAKQFIEGPHTHDSNLVRDVLGFLWSPFWKMDEIEYLHAHDRQSHALLASGTPMVSNNKFISELPWYAIGTRLILPDLDRVGRKRDEILVYRRMAQVALALNAYRTTHGRYPATLDEAQTTWGALLPHDFFTQQPFLYRLKGGQTLLYSAGPNRQDEGGTKADRTGASGADTHIPDDLVWPN